MIIGRCENPTPLATSYSTATSRFAVTLLENLLAMRNYTTHYMYVYPATQN